MIKKNTDIAVVGAGGMGALFGAILSENGLDVVLIDSNYEHVESIKSKGLIIDGFGGKRSIRISATTDPFQLESANLLLFQCKAYCTRDASKSIRHLIHENSVCISFQNGLGNEEIISEELGSDKVLGGLTSMAGLLKGPGMIRDFSRVPSYIGEMHGGTSIRAEKIAEKLSKSGLETHVSENIRSEIWKKLLGNISLSAISALTNLTSARSMQIPELKSVSYKAMEEAFEVAIACGISLNHQVVVNGIELISKVGGTGDNKSSMCVDLLNQRRTEVEFIYGEVIRFADEKGINTPTLKVLYGLVKGIESNYNCTI